MTIYVFYNNDPLASDQGGGAEHLRGIYRALKRSGKPFVLVTSRMQIGLESDNVEYISNGANILRFFMAMFVWFIKNRAKLTDDDVFHFHRNYTIWPKFLIVGRRGKTIITYHNHTGKILEDWFGKSGSKVVRSVMLFFERKAVSIADKIIFVSDRVRQTLKDEVLRGGYSKTLVIPAAFDSAAFENCTKAAKSNTNRLISIGRLASIKNFNLAIETVEKLHELKHEYYLTIVGDGELKDELKERVGNSPCKEYIKLYGLARHSMIQKLVEEHSIVLVTSKFEASPTVVKEGIASFRPVVTTDVGDVGIWVSEGKNGFICEHNATSLSRAILDASKLVAEDLYIQSIDFKNFSEEKIMDKVLEQYE